MKINNDNKIISKITDTKTLEKQGVVIYDKAIEIEKEMEENRFLQTFHNYNKLIEFNFKLKEPYIPNIDLIP